MTEPNPANPVVAQFRQAFHQSRLALVKSHGPEAFDQGQVLYVCANTGKNVVIRDAFYGAQADGPIDAFIARLVEGWWKRRQVFGGDKGAGADLRPVAAVYARYLGEVGFDYSVEFAIDQGPVCAWRMNGRGKVTRLSLPADEAMFRDQTGTFFDLRAGWRWLVEAQQAEQALVVAEVQRGYLIGVRPGVADHPAPAQREDPALDEVLGRYGHGTFDTVEFLAGEIPDRYPFHSERYPVWMGPLSTLVAGGTVEAFVLADASEYLSCIEDLCSRRGIAVEWVDPDTNLRVALHHGPLRLEMAFDYPFLRTLHTGRSFVEGTRAFYLPTVDALDDALDLYNVLKDHATAHTLTLEDGVVLVAQKGDVVAGRWNLMALAGRQVLRGQAAAADTLALFGFDPALGDFVAREMRLDRCPITGAPARVNKVVRPKALLGVDERTLVGVPIGEHVVFYTLDSETHSTPVEPGPDRDLHALEAAYRDGLCTADVTLLEAHTLDVDGPKAALLVGFDVGSLVLEPARLKALLEASALPAEGQQHAYAFYADAVVLSQAPLKGRAVQQARVAALEAVQPRFPARTWPLDLARLVDLDVEPLGGATLPT